MDRNIREFVYNGFIALVFIMALTLFAFVYKQLENNFFNLENIYEREILVREEKVYERKIVEKREVIGIIYTDREYEVKVNGALCNKNKQNIIDSITSLTNEKYYVYVSFDSSGKVKEVSYVGI